MQRAPLVFAAAALGLVAGLGLASLRGGTPAVIAPVAAPATDDRAGDGLRAELRASQAAREELEAEVALLREALAIAGESPSAPLPAVADPSADAAPKPAPAPTAGRRQTWFDADALAGPGLDDADVERLRAHFEQHQMDQLYLRDEAVREGWFRSGRYQKALRRLGDETRAEIGEDDYDLMLFATGRNNRVRVGEVLDTSPAREAGLEAGDLVLRYDGDRVFAAHELQLATAHGREGDLVALDVLRDGEARRFYVPRGPLGVRIKSVLQPPESLR